jgi:hypothetical protein
MKHGDDARIEESNNLRLALATFALQLDAFEVRTQEGSSAVSRPGKLLIPRTDRGCDPRKDAIIGDQ